MTSAADLLLRAAAAGLEIEATPAGTLKVRGASGAVLDAWVPLLTAHKPQLLELLRQRGAARAGVDRHCRNCLFVAADGVRCCIPLAVGLALGRDGRGTGGATHCAGFASRPAAPAQPSGGRHA